jgi:hypothetical protein
VPGHLTQTPYNIIVLSRICACEILLPLDFLRELRIKTLRKFMEHSFRYLLQVLLSAGLVLFVTVAVKTRAFPQYAVLGWNLRGTPATGRATLFPTGTATTPAVVLPLRSALENSAPTFTRAASSWAFRNYRQGAKDLTLRWQL